MMYKNQAIIKNKKSLIETKILKSTYCQTLETVDI